MNTEYSLACEYYAKQGFDMATLHDSYCYANTDKSFEDWLINKAMEDTFATIHNL